MSPATNGAASAAHGRTRSASLMRDRANLGPGVPLTPGQAPAGAVGRAWLEEFLTHPTADLDSEHRQLLVRCGLAPYAYGQGVADDPKKRPLFQAFMATTARHLKLRAELQTLVRAWSAAGIDVLLFKGFHLAEFVHTAPGLRFYRDVDLVMDPAQAEEASRIAQAHGWVERWHVSHPVTMSSPYNEAYCGHEVLHLEHPALGVTVDVHRRILHNLHDQLPWCAPQARITAAVWQASDRVAWGGGVVRLPAPEDAILIGPVLNRCWSAWDDWVLEPHDYLDFKTIVESCGVTRAGLVARARSLGCVRTLELFLERCDPFNRHLVLREPTRRERQRWNLALTLERGHAGLARRVVAIKDWPGEVSAAVRQLPTALRVVRLLRRGVPPEEIAHALGETVSVRRSLGHREWWHLQRGTARVLGLLRVDAAEYWSAYVLTLYAVLRRRGCPAEFRLRESPALELEGRRLLPAE